MMGEYGREMDEYEDYDGYEDYEDGEEAQEEEEEEEEEKERQPTEEELRYLELRARLKERIRKKMQKENGSASSKSSLDRKRSSSDNYGSFFGPSQSVISQRVIQESKSFLENQHLALRMVQSQHGNKKTSSSTLNAPKNGGQRQLPRVNELKVKVQKLKDTRDYSFLLSDDAELPAPMKEPVSRNVSAQNSEARSAPLQQKSRQNSGSISSRDIRRSCEERNSVSINKHAHSTPGSYKSTSGSYKSTSGSNHNPALMNSRRQPDSNRGGTGPGRSTGAKSSTLKAVRTTEKKAPLPGQRNILPAAAKPPPSRMQSSVPKQQLEQRRETQKPHRAKLMPRQLATSSKPQINIPVKHISRSAPLQDKRPRKMPVRQSSDDEDDMALSMIRKMFNTRRFEGRPDDDSDMEANYDDIMREEMRSAQIARKEDEEQLRLIEEEERRERMRKLEKKRRLSQR